MRLADLRDDPVRLVKMCWPRVVLYKQEREIMESVRDNVVTMVPAANMMGKDFTAALTALWFFLTRHPVRIVTTSADHGQLQAVLWGEIRKFIQESEVPLTVDRGGPLIVNHLHIRKVHRGEVDGLSYILGRQASKGEGMLGHHIANVGDGVPRTLAIADEASGVDDLSWTRMETWAKRMLAIGNCYPCSNFFWHGIKAGDLLAPEGMAV